MRSAVGLIRRLRQFLIGLALAALLAAAPSFAKTITLTSVDNHTSVCLIEGDTLVIALPSPTEPTYRWEKVLPRPSPLTGLNDDYQPPQNPRGSGTQTFRFNAATVGEGTLVFNFSRQNPGPAPAVTQTFVVDVSVASGEPGSSVLIGFYQGTLPCADCSGLRTELRLYAKGADDFTDTIYVSTRTYLGARNGDQSFTDRGEWAVLKGDSTDPNATVYALNPEVPEQSQYLLLRPGGAALTQLDREMKPIEVPSSMNMTLKKVK